MEQEELRYVMEGLPEEFTNWIKNTYGGFKLLAWQLNLMAKKGYDWRQDPHYRWWVENGKPTKSEWKPAPEPKPEPKPEPSGAFDAQVNYLRSLDLPDDVINYLANFTSEADLQKRISYVATVLDNPEDNPGWQEEIYNELMYYETDFTRGRRKQYGTELGQYQQQLAYQEQNRLYEEAKVAPYRMQALTEIENSPYITAEDKARYRDMPIDQYTKIMRSIADQRAREAGQMTRAERIQAERKAGPGYRQEVDAFLRAFNGPGKTQRIQGIPPLPSMEPTVRSFQQGMEYAPGTKLRQFLESELPQTIQDIQPARQAWWIQAHPTGEVEEEDTYRSEQRRLQGQEKRYAGLAASASTAPVVGGTFFGEGGPAAIAQAALESTQARLAGLNPEDYGMPNVSRGRQEIPEDPLIGALKRLKAGYKPRYYRQAGTGLGGSLTPSVRFR